MNDDGGISLWQKKCQASALGNVKNNEVFIAGDHSEVQLIICGFVYHSMTWLFFFFFKHLKYKLSLLFNTEISSIFAVCREDSYQSIVSCAAVVLTPVEPTVDTRKKEQTIMPDVSKQWVIQITWSFTSAI